MNLQIENSKGKSSDPFKEHKGIGIENVRKRLELIYPGKHQLEIREDNETFKVDLRLEFDRNQE